MPATQPVVERVLYDMADACSALGLSKPTVYALISDGSLDTVMIGKRRFTTPDMLKACIEKLHSQSPAPRPGEVVNNRHRPRKV